MFRFSSRSEQIVTRCTNELTGGGDGAAVEGGGGGGSTRVTSDCAGLLLGRLSPLFLAAGRFPRADF